MYALLCQRVNLSYHPGGNLSRINVGCVGDPHNLSLQLQLPALAAFLLS